MFRKEAEESLNQIFNDVVGRHEAVTRSIALIGEMQAVPGADPALEFVKATLEKELQGDIDLMHVAGLSQRSVEGAPEGWEVPKPKQGMGDFYKESIDDSAPSMDLKLRGCTPHIITMDDSPFLNVKLPSVDESPYVKRDPDNPQLLHVVVGYNVDNASILMLARSILDQYSETQRRVLNLIGYEENVAKILVSVAPLQVQTHRVQLDQLGHDAHVNYVKQMIENVAAQRENNDLVDTMPLEDPLRYLEWHLEQLRAPKHDLKPVLELKKMAEIFQEWIDHESLPSAVKFDLGNMIKSLNAIAGRHIAEEVSVAAKVEGDLTSMSRLSVSNEVIAQAAVAHPLDINQDALKEVVQWFASIYTNNPGWENLGKEGFIIVPHSNNVSEAAIDSVRPYLMSYGGGVEHSAEALRGAAARSGSLALTNMPEWFATTYGHVSKGGFASLLYHTMLSVAAQDKPRRVYVSGDKRKELEVALRNGNKNAWLDFLESVEESDSDE